MFHRFPLRVGALGLLLSTIFVLVTHHSCAHQLPATYFGSANGDAASDQPFFSPATNLEEVDINLIDHAQHSIDVAMYTFTDRRLALALRRAAERDVKIRVYRDREQFEEEQKRGDTVASVLSGNPNISIKVKASNELMHEKSFACDGAVLRSGSGNWSVYAARYQDNEISITRSRSSVDAFLQDFATMWSRTDNVKVQ
jgi:phosphatidylserine/phosphatidylglycerophosphate/cardiolipin synthase-like enzyme